MVNIMILCAVAGLLVLLLLPAAVFYFPLWRRCRPFALHPPLAFLLVARSDGVPMRRLIDAYAEYASVAPDSEDHLANLRLLRTLWLCSVPPEQPVDECLRLRASGGSFVGFRCVALAKMIGVDHTDLKQRLAELNCATPHAKPWQVVGGDCLASLEELKERLSSGLIPHDAIVFCPETGSWLPAVEVDELRLVIVRDLIRLKLAPQTN